MTRFKVTDSLDTKVLLSTIWLFATLNYLYCDVLGLMDTDSLRQYIAGTINGIDITPSFLLGAAILVEIPMAMVLLSRILKSRLNRLVNILAGSIMTVVQIATLFVGDAAGYYIFCSVLEIAATASIVWIAWNWQAVEAT